MIVEQVGIVEKHWSPYRKEGILIISYWVLRDCGDFLEVEELIEIAKENGTYTEVPLFEDLKEMDAEYLRYFN